MHIIHCRERHTFCSPVFPSPIFSPPPAPHYYRVFFVFYFVFLTKTAASFRVWILFVWECLLEKGGFGVGCFGGAKKMYIDIFYNLDMVDTYGEEIVGGDIIIRQSVASYHKPTTRPCPVSCVLCPRFLKRVTRQTGARLDCAE